MTAPVDQEVILRLPELKVECYAGTPLEFFVPVLQGDGSPTPIASLTAARAQIRLSWQSNSPLHTWHTDDPTGMELSGTTNAGVIVRASAAETAVWQAQWSRLDAVWDLEVLDGDGVPRRICKASPFIVHPEITRNT